MLTIKEFSSTNRSKTIGNSLYRICREQDNFGKWYIHETFNDIKTWTGNNAYYNNNLQKVIDIFNNITKEKEVISLMFGNI